MSATTVIGWTLVHFVWQGAVVGALIWIVSMLTRRSPASLRYAVFVAALAVVAAIPVVTAFPLSSGRSALPRLAT